LRSARLGPQKAGLGHAKGWQRYIAGITILLVAFALFELRLVCFGHGRFGTLAGKLGASFGQLLVVSRSGAFHGVSLSDLPSAGVTNVTATSFIFWTRVFPDRFLFWTTLARVL
jgi:hypothetical protein